MTLIVTAVVPVEYLELSDGLVEITRVLDPALWLLGSRVTAKLKRLVDWFFVYGILLSFLLGFYQICKRFISVPLHNDIVSVGLSLFRIKCNFFKLYSA